MGFRGEPACGRQADVLTLFRPTVEMVAVHKFEGHHVRILHNLARHLQKEGAGAAVAEIDHHVNVLRVTGDGGGRPNTDLDRRHAP